MSDLEHHLSQWEEAGLIDEAAARRIREFEAGRRGERDETFEPRPGMIETLLYFGLVILAAGVTTFLAANWSELSPAGRSLAVALPAAVALAAGAILRTFSEPQWRRGGHVAWMVGTGLSAAFLGVLQSEYQTFDGDDDQAFVTITLLVLALAAGLWAISRSNPQALAMAVAAFWFCQAMGVLSPDGNDDEFDQAWAGLAVLLAGVAGLALVELGARPRPLLQFLAVVLVVTGPYEAGIGPGNVAFEVLAAICAAGVVALGLQRRSFAVVVVGLVAAFIVLISFVFEHLSKTIGVPMALMLNGALVVGGVILVAAVRQRRRALNLAA